MHFLDNTHTHVERGMSSLLDQIRVDRSLLSQLKELHTTDTHTHTHTQGHTHSQSGPVEVEQRIKVLGCSYC